jgi:hypothetical protein
VTTPWHPHRTVSGITRPAAGFGRAGLIVQQQSTGATYYAEEGSDGFLQWGSATTSLGPGRASDAPDEIASSPEAPRNDTFSGGNFFLSGEDHAR